MVSIHTCRGALTPGEPSCGQAGPCFSLEIVGRQVRDEPGPAKRLDENRAGLVVVLKCTWRDFAAVKRVSLAGHEAIAQIGDCQPVALNAVRTSGMQVVALFQVLFQCGLPGGGLLTAPSPEVVHFAADFLRPASRIMRKQREIGVGLGGLVLAAWTGRLGHSECSLTATLARAPGRSHVAGAH